MNDKRNETVSSMRIVLMVIFFSVLGTALMVHLNAYDNLEQFMRAYSFPGLEEFFVFTPAFFAMGLALYAAKQIEELLAGGEMITRSSDQSGRDIVTVSDGTNTIESVFAKRSGRDFYPNVAAYRLDRLLNLDMVPVTVRRELDGVDGSLRFNPKNWIDEIERQEKGSGGSAWCPLPEQWNAMTVFDVLVYNEGRQGANILYSLDFWQLMLVAYGDAFSTRKGVPARLKNVPYDVGQGWKDALSSLTEDALQQSLGDVIGEKRVRALIARAEALAEAD